MFIISSVYVKGKEIRFSITCNVFHIYCPKEEYQAAKDDNLNKIAMEAYKNSNKISISETNYGFAEEIILYNDYVFCFIASTSYKLLFNYLPAKDLFVFNSFPNLNKYQIEKIHDISKQDVIGNVKITLYNGSTIDYNVICSREAFLNYCKNNSENQPEENINQLIFNNFLENLATSKIDMYNVNPYYGLTTDNPSTPHLFNYLYFDKLIIITNYKKKAI